MKFIVYSKWHDVEDVCRVELCKNLADLNQTRIWYDEIGLEIVEIEVLRSANYESLCCC